MYKKLSFLFLAGTLGQGGAEKQMYLLADILNKKSHKVSVVTFGINEYWELKIKELGISVYSVKTKLKIFRILQIFKLCLILKPDVFYSYHFYTSGYVGFIGKILTNIITIGSIRSNGFAEFKSNNIFSRLHLFFPDLIICNSRQGATAIKYIYPSLSLKIHTINNSIPILDSPKSHIYQIDQPLKLVFVGRLIAVKNPFLFIDLCRNLIYLGFKLEASIFGDGNLKNDIIEYIDNYKMSSFIRVHGIDPDISTNLHSYNILINTSEYEGTPNVLLEAINNEICFFALKNDSTVEFASYNFVLSQLLFEDLSQVLNLCINYANNSKYYINLIKNAKLKLISDYSSEFQYFKLIHLLNEYK